MQAFSLSQTNLLKSIFEINNKFHDNANVSCLFRCKHNFFVCKKLMIFLVNACVHESLIYSMS